MIYNVRQYVAKILLLITDSEYSEIGREAKEARRSHIMKLRTSDPRSDLLHKKTVL